MSYTQGIYTCWEKAKEQISHFPGNIYKSFKSQTEAQEFMSEKVSPSKNITDTTSKTKALVKVENESSYSIHVYTDGACVSNGKKNAQAGYGVYFGMNDSRNICARLDGSLQTNNRAELTAIIKAIECIKDHESAIIYTDSIYCKNGIEKWIKRYVNFGLTPVGN